MVTSVLGSLLHEPGAMHPVSGWPAFDLERTAVRVLVQDAGERILLLHVSDTHRPTPLRWWELPGGGIEAGESTADAAVRELAEETGLIVAAGRISAPTWHRDCTYQYRGRRIWQHETVVTARLDEHEPRPQGSGRTPSELEDVIGHRWWTVDEIRASADRFFPGRLPSLVTDALAGTVIDEPFEFWD